MYIILLFSNCSKAYSNSIIKFEFGYRYLFISGVRSHTNISARFSLFLRNVSYD